jgi:hypothetical protein
MLLVHWVNVSYVCRHWRNVALNCATLWTYLFVMSPRWTEELLARSKAGTIEAIREYGLSGRNIQGGVATLWIK